MFSFLKQLLTSRTGRSCSPGSHGFRARLERLESRNMLSVAAIVDDFARLAEVSVELDRLPKADGEMQRPGFDLPSIIPDDDPWQSMPSLPEDGLPFIPEEEMPFVPDEGAEHQENDSDLGGMVEVGDTGETEATTPNYGAPGGDDSEIDLYQDRESRDVLSMLAGLRYRPGGLDAGSPAAEEVQAGDEWESLVQDTAKLRNDQQQTAQGEGGVIILAFDEIVDELAAEREAVDVDIDALLDVPVQIDASSGRFRAFEVLTHESAQVAPAVDESEAVGATREPGAGVDLVEADVTAEGTAGPQRVLRARDDANDAAETTTGPVVPLSIVAPAPVDDSSKTMWTSAVALVTGGLVVQMIRERKFEQLTARATRVYRRFVRTYLRRRRRHIA
jgi:hypothetical protein